jgi:hypothetical protein
MQIAALPLTFLLSSSSSFLYDDMTHSKSFDANCWPLQFLGITESFNPDD